MVYLKEADQYVKNVCEKFRVRANIVTESVPLNVPFDWEKVNEHLKTMFPGLGDRVHIKEHSVVMPKMASSANRNVNINRFSSTFTLQRNDNDSIPAPSVCDSDEIPEKRHKFNPNYSPVSIGSNESLSVQKQHLHKCLTNIRGIVDNVFDLNAELNEKLKSMEQRYEMEIKEFVNENEQLSKQFKLLNRDMENKIDSLNERHELELKDLIDDYTRRMFKVDEKWEHKMKSQLQATSDRYEHEISLLKAKYDKCVAQFESERKKIFDEKCDLIERKNREIEVAVNKVKEKCRRECAARIEDAKNKKFCIACGSSKPLDLIYVCNADCKRRYW